MVRRAGVSDGAAEIGSGAGTGAAGVGLGSAGVLGAVAACSACSACAARNRLSVLGVIYLSTMLVTMRSETKLTAGSTQTSKYTLRLRRSLMYFCGNFI